MMAGELGMVISWHAYAGLATMRALWRGVRIGMGAARILATHRGLPLPLRILFVVGCIQIPVLPVDEICLALALGIMAVFYRPVLRAAWVTARAAWDVKHA